jgi:8-oxo-dGTP pyrophosphatase MutT (NUDIX family)
MRPVEPIAQAGGIAYRRDQRGVTILLVRAKRDPSQWILPKGHIEEDETAAEAAVRETWEEAGVKGDLVGPVGAPLEFDSGREFVSVQYFLIRARVEIPDTDGRAKKWFPFDEAIEAVTFAETRQFLRQARAIIDLS